MVRKDNLEELLEPDDEEYSDDEDMSFHPDLRLTTTKLGQRKKDSRIRSNGVIVFDCSHMSSPTRRPLKVLAVVWYDFNDDKAPSTSSYNCHDCESNDNYLCQRVLLGNSEASDKIDNLGIELYIAKERRRRTLS